MVVVVDTCSVIFEKPNSIRSPKHYSLTYVVYLYTCAFVYVCVCIFSDVLASFALTQELIETTVSHV